MKVKNLLNSEIGKKEFGVSFVHDLFFYFYPHLKRRTMNKPRIVKDYSKIDESVKQQIKLTYPEGFEEHLIKFNNKEGMTVSALPFETEDKYYLVRMTVSQAQAIIEDDDDYDDDGMLRDEVREEYEDNLDEDFDD